MTHHINDYISELNFIIFKLELSKKIQKDHDDNPRPRKKRKLL